MKSSVSRLFLLVGDLLAVFLSLSIAYETRVFFDDYFVLDIDGSLWMYTGNITIYTIIMIVFFYEGIYKHRYDFWEETRLVVKGVSISLVLVLSVFALNKSIDDFSRFIVVLSFMLMLVLIPTLKIILKPFLFKIGLWRRNAEILGDSTYIKEEIFDDKYLGYIHTDDCHAQTIFVDTHGVSIDEIENRLAISLKEKKEVLFMPLLQSYNFANARVIELTNTRKNLIVLENSLLKKSNIFIKNTSDIFLSILIFPLLVALFVFIVFLMKKEEPKGSIFFRQKRMGLNGREFTCYKFRSMYENGDEILEKYLQDNPNEVANYEKYHKYNSDPRITRVGRILRKTSLDELPQIINVFRGEMSLIGPRPYMLNEKKKIAERVDMVLAVKPGVTGLWQVSGRSDVDFHSRVDMDVWYTRNWNLWLDIVILVKTIKVVLFRDGAH
ncbi:sugar transferase [Campylobacterota bacterium]